jgi:hypothetical protein
MSGKEGYTWNGKPWKIPVNSEVSMEPSAVSTLRGGIGIVEVLEMKVGEGNVVTAEPESNITSVSGETEETAEEETTAFFALETGGKIP